MTCPAFSRRSRRILAPDGLFLAALVGGQTLRELRFCLAQAQEEIEGGASPRVAPFADLRDLGGLLQRAGLALPVTDCDAFTVRYRKRLRPDARPARHGRDQFSGRRRPTPAAPRRGCSAPPRFTRKNSPIPTDASAPRFEIVWASGWAPHESQQKPLAPGSARMPLSAVLGDKSRAPGGNSLARQRIAA